MKLRIKAIGMGIMVLVREYSITPFTQYMQKKKERH